MGRGREGVITFCDLEGQGSSRRTFSLNVYVTQLCEVRCSSEGGGGAVKR